MSIPSPALPIRIGYRRPTRASDPADGAFVRGGEHTVETRIFYLTWPVIKEAEFEALETEFNTHLCVPFTWQIPQIGGGGPTISVTFVEGSLTSHKTTGVLWSASAALEEEL
jgi:hypothetical protein